MLLICPGSRTSLDLVSADCTWVLSIDTASAFWQDSSDRKWRIETSSICTVCWAEMNPAKENKAGIFGGAFLWKALLMSFLRAILNCDGASQQFLDECNQCVGSWLKQVPLYAFLRSFKLSMPSVNAFSPYWEVLFFPTSLRFFSNQSCISKILK